MITRRVDTFRMRIVASSAADISPDVGALVAGSAAPISYQPTRAHFSREASIQDRVIQWEPTVVSLRGRKLRKDGSIGQAYFTDDTWYRPSLLAPDMPVWLVELKTEFEVELVRQARPWMPVDTESAVPTTASPLPRVWALPRGVPPWIDGPCVAIEGNPGTFTTHGAGGYGSFSLRHLPADAQTMSAHRVAHTPHATSPQEI